MENASKALIMAGGILISLIIIGALVFFFNNLKNFQGTQQSEDEILAVTEWNKQYTVYERNVYGSELLSLANKVVDYNLRESNNKGYTKLEVYVVLTEDFDTNYFKQGTYKSSDIKKEIETINKEVERIGKISVSSTTSSNVSRKISQLATMRTKDIEELGIEYASYSSNVNLYNTYKTLVTEIKSKEFRYIKSEYDKNTGRITELHYKL